MITPSIHPDNLPVFWDHFDSHLAKPTATQVHASIEAAQQAKMDPVEKTMCQACNGTLIPAEASFGTQLSVLATRELRTVPRSSIRCWSKVVAALVAGLVVGAIYQGVPDDQVPPVLKTTLEMASAFGLSFLALIFLDRGFFHFEEGAGLYNALPYYLVTAGSSTIVLALCTAMYVVIVWAISGLPWAGYFLANLLAVELCMLLIHALVLCIGYSTATNIGATAIGAAAITYFFSFNGFSANEAITPSYSVWLIYGSPNYYAFQMMIGQLSQGSFSGAADVQFYRQTQFNNTDDVYWRNAFILMGGAMALHVGAFFSCRSKHRQQR
eukprot:TRINITY_DN532_c0_g1_i1.p1 TRINITY_DN532_c0_g1~~TRINITY_DN532_c0_g1_i1.p1  ORF type:complete len:326 (+),score=82.86 TRINITY_DN532_c0_g1_i1:740-1717(+)